MDTFINGIFDRINGFLSSPFVSLGVRVLLGYLVLLWLAASYWTWKDARERSGSTALAYICSAFVLLASPLFFVLAISLYRLVRPSERHDEREERALAEEVLLAELAAEVSCPACAKRVDERWVACPNCGSALGERCSGCNNAMRAGWRLCAWCGRARTAAARPAASGRGPSPFSSAG